MMRLHVKTVLNLGIIFLCLVPLFYHVQATWYQKLFNDEAHSLFYFHSYSWFQLFTTSIEPIHPNGFYLLLKFLYFLTPNVLALRTWMFVFFLGSTMLFYRLLQTLHIRGTSLWLGILLWTSSAYIWRFSYLLRMYGVGMFLVLFSLWLLLTSFTDKKRIWFSLIMDVLALSVVYGAGLFVLAKWLGWVTYLFGIKKKIFHHWWLHVLPLAVSITVLSLIALQYIFHVKEIDARYLGWVHIPRFSDISLYIVSFFTGAFLPYYEDVIGGFLPQHTIVIGNIGSVLLLCGFAGILFSSFGIKTITKKFQLYSHQEQLFLSISVCLGILSISLFCFSLFTGSHLFHIRQLFAIPIIGSLGLAWILSQLRAKAAVMGFVFIFFLSMVNVFTIFQSSTSHRQAYYQGVPSLPEGPVIASIHDAIFLYEHCQNFHYDELDEACQKKGISVLRSADQSISFNSWWMTRTAYQSNSMFQNYCQSDPSGLWKCHK